MTNDSLDNDMVADALKFEEVDDLPAVTADAIKLVTNDGEDIQYVHADHLGSPQKMTDKDRNVVWDAAYLPFGEEHSLTGSAANDNRFPGQRLESETGLHYNYYRDYDPSTGRYLQSDPIGLAGGINTYGYVSGNPLRYVDPRGEAVMLLPLLVPAISGKVIVAGSSLLVGLGAGILLTEIFDTPIEQSDERMICRLPGTFYNNSSDNSGKNDQKYFPAPKDLEAFPDAKKAKPKTPVQGGGGMRRRWKDSKGSIYEWDSQHGKVEKYDKRGKHKGEYDPKTGKQTKPAIKGRKVEK